MAKANTNNNEEVTHSEAAENPQAVEETAVKADGQKQQLTDNNQKVISHPKDVAALVMAQLNNVNNKKDELTIAIKALADTTDQLVKAYAGNIHMIQQLSKRVRDLEEKAGEKTEV